MNWRLEAVTSENALDILQVLRNIFIEQGSSQNTKNHIVGGVKYFVVDGNKYTISTFFEMADLFNQYEVEAPFNIDEAKDKMLEHNGDSIDIKDLGLTWYGTFVYGLRLIDLFAQNKGVFIGESKVSAIIKTLSGKTTETLAYKAMLCSYFNLDISPHSSGILWNNFIYDWFATNKDVVATFEDKVKQQKTQEKIEKAKHQEDVKNEKRDEREKRNQQVSLMLGIKDVNSLKADNAYKWFLSSDDPKSFRQLKINGKINIFNNTKESVDYLLDNGYKLDIFYMAKELEDEYSGVYDKAWRDIDKQRYDFLEYENKKRKEDGNIPLAKLKKEYVFINEDGRFFDFTETQFSYLREYVKYRKNISQKNDNESQMFDSIDDVKEELREAVKKKDFKKFIVLAKQVQAFIRNKQEKPIELTGKEFGEFDLTTNEGRKALREVAKNHLLGLIRDEHGNPKEYWVRNTFLNQDIEIRKRGIKETLSWSANPIKLLALAKIEEIIATAVGIGDYIQENTKKDKKNRVDSYYHLSNKIMIDRRTYSLDVVIEKDDKGLLHYDFIVDKDKAAQSSSTKAFPDTKSGGSVGDDYTAFDKYSNDTLDKSQAIFDSAGSGSGYVLNLFVKVQDENGNWVDLPDDEP